MEAKEIIIKMYCGFLVQDTTIEGLHMKFRKIDLGDTNGFIRVDNPNVRGFIESQQKQIEELEEENEKVKLDLKLQEDINSDHCDCRFRLVKENTELKEKVKELEIASGNVCQQFGHHDDDHLNHLKQLLNK